MPEKRFEEEKFEAKVSRGMLIRILALAKPHILLLLGFLAFVSATSFMDSYNTLIVRDIIDKGILVKDWDTLSGLIVRYAVVVAGTALTVCGFIYCAARLGETIQYDLRKKLFNHLQDLSFSYYDRTAVGWIMSRVTSDTSRISDFVTWMILDLVWATVNIFVSMFFMFSINWRLALAVLAVLPLLVVVGVKFRKLIIVQFRKVRATNSKITGAYNEGISGVKVIKSLTKEAENLASFGSLTSDMKSHATRAAVLSAMFLPTVQLISAFALAAVILVGGLQSKVGNLTIGGIKAFVSYIMFMMWPIQDLSRVFAEMQNAFACAERVFSLLDTKPDIVDRENCAHAPSIAGEIEFADVSFYYEESKPVLSHFNLKVRAGETIALVGPTGGGKSTIVNLACRFYEPKSGVISVDGADYTSLSLESYQSRIGVVLQTPHLFSGNIRENIRYGRLDATDAEVETAAKLAHAHEFIEGLAKGYDEEVGEGGVLLSVGQKQLISLARAILAKPSIIVMDEATSSIDTITESLIQKGMETLLEGSTSFVIAHRLSTIKHADRSLVIEEARSRRWEPTGNSSP